MLRSLVSGALKARLALWAVELALPSGTDLKKRFRSALLGVVAAVAGGVLFASCVVVLIVGAGVALHEFAHYTIWQAAAIMGVIAIALIAALLMYGRQQLKEAFKAVDEASSFSFAKTEDSIQELINGFIEGLVVDKPAKSHSKHQPSQHKKAA
jgi:hypothetical protein